MNKIQELLKTLKNLGFEDAQYQENIESQRLLIKQSYITQKHMVDLIEFCEKNQFSFDLVSTQYRGINIIQIEIIESIRR